MKIFSTFGVHRKIGVLGGKGGHENSIYRRELPKKGGLNNLKIYRGGLGKKKEGGWYTNAYYGGVA